MGNGENTLTAKTTTWIGVVSSIIAVIMTVFNGITKIDIDKQQALIGQRQQEIETNLKFAEQRIRDRAQTTEEKKSDMSRFTFVHGLLPDLTSGDATKKELTISLVRLVLDEGEEEGFFSALTKSGNQQLRIAGDAAIAIVNSVKDGKQKAAEKEREGYQALIDGNFENARIAFTAAENAYPTYNQAYELARYLNQQRQNFNDREKQQEMREMIIQKYSIFASADVVKQLREKN